MAHGLNNGVGRLVNTIRIFNLNSFTEQYIAPILKSTAIPQLKTSLSYYDHQNNSSAPWSSNQKPLFTMWGRGVFVDRPTLRASMAQGLFLGRTGRRAIAHTRPEFPKMPTVPSAFPLLGAPQAPGDKPNLPEGSKSLGGRPPEAVGKSSPGTETHSARTASR